MITRHRIRRLSRWGVAGLALTVPAALFVLPAQASEDGDAAENRLFVATDQSVENWNPFLQIYFIEHQFRQVQYEPLIRHSAEDYTATEGLAEEWEVSDDGLTWTFTLRETVWHDEQPVTADDVEYTYHIILNDEVISARSADTVELIESVEAVDDRTVEIRITEPSVTLELSDQVIVPKHIWEEHEGNWSDWGNDDFPIIGSGPWQAVAYETDQFIRYEANENYWRGAPGFDELIFQYYTEPDTAVAGLEAGEVDIVGNLNEAQVRRLDGMEGITTVVAPNRAWLALRFNTGARTIDGQEFGQGHPALSDVAVRQALHHAIDKQELIDRVRGGFGEVASSIVPSVFGAIYWEPDDDVRVDFDLEEASRILDEAGYAMGDDGIRVSPDGDPLVFSFGIDAGDADRESTALFIEEWFSEIGVGVEQVISEDVHDQFYAGDIDFTFTGWGINPDPTYNLIRQTCGQLPEEPPGGNSDAFYCNEHYDNLVAQQAAETDPEARAEILAEVQEILYTDAPLIFLWYPTVMEAYNSDKIADVTFQPTDGGMIMGQIGPWAYHSAAPTGEGGGGLSTSVLVGAGAAVVLGAAVAGVGLARRRQTADDRE
ncbi:ABC transporter substrate-binding protein [Phytoactinopolyspora mesophila]|nr:peptide ABC transporter substrate-binding protein [Phytoactinopolyspora mesophila]